MRSAWRCEQPENQRMEGMWEAFPHSGLTLWHGWVLFLPGTKEELKAEKALPTTTAFTVRTNNRYLFIWFPLKAISAHKCKQIHAAAAFYCCRPPRHKTAAPRFSRSQNKYHLLLPTTWNKILLIQFYTIICFHAARLSRTWKSSLRE